MSLDDAKAILVFPDPPAELWMLWLPESEAWVVSVDDAPGGPTYLASLGEEEAKAAAEHQEYLYGIRCVPVRVK
jgi:hypothetical protein